MADDRQWALAWAKFEAMYKNLPTSVTENHVRDFHEILGLLEEASSEDLASFRVSDSRVQPRLTSFNYVTGRKNYSATRYCDRAYLMTQMDGVRGYFDNLQPPPQKARVGF
jgi:hypothetical protein